MNIKMKVAGLVGAATLMLLSVQSIAIGNGGQPYCWVTTDPVGTGCWNQNCTQYVFLQPSQGYTRYFTYQCCYSKLGNFTSSTNLGCSDSMLGCCSFIASAPDCPLVPPCPAHDPNF